MVYDVLKEDNLISNFLNGFSKAINGNNKPESYYLKGSISNFSKDLIMTFPTMCDNSLPPSTASMCSKANERNIVSMLQMLFASVQFNGQNGAEVLSRIHKNMKVSYGMDDYINALDRLPQTLSQFENAQVNRVALEMVNDLKIPKRSLPVDSFSERSLNFYEVRNVYGNTVIKEGRWDELEDDEIKRMKPSKADAGDTVSDELDRAKIAQIRDELKRNKNREKREDDELNLRIDQLRNNAKYSASREEREKQTFAQNYANNAREEIRRQAAERRAGAKDIRDREKHGWEREKHAWDAAKFQNDMDADSRRRELDAWQRSNYASDAISKQLLDSDIKKANELMPSLMIIRYNEIDADGKIYDQKPFVAGVKSRLIAVDPIDIIERISAKNKTKVNFLNLIRATTGEIKLLKDFMLCVDQAKIDARNGVKKGEAARMWKVLENRSIKNNWNKIVRKGNDASAITTLVINQETVNIIKKEYDFDLEKPANAKMILDAYNLLGIMIADESIEVVKVLYAGNDMFEQQAYSSLQKESNDNSYKKIINLIGNMNRR